MGLPAENRLRIDLKIVHSLFRKNVAVAEVTEVNVLADQGVRCLGRQFHVLAKDVAQFFQAIQQPPIDPHVGRHKSALVAPQCAVVDPLGR